MRGKQKNRTIGRKKNTKDSERREIAMNSTGDRNSSLLTSLELTGAFPRGENAEATAVVGKIGVEA